MIDSTELWRRVGLEELRSTLERVQGLTEQFETALRALPPCDTCARSSLLKQLEIAGQRLGSEAISISVLAESLHQAMMAIEKAHKELGETSATPCQCPSGHCTCHE